MTLRPGRRGLMLAGGLGLVMVPELIWIGLDRSIWGADTAVYGSASIGLYSTLRLHLHDWVHALLHTVQWKSPGTSWIGQFFVPLHSIAGSYERALLLSIVVTQAGSIAMVFVAARRLGATLAAAAAGALALASAPLFVAVGRYYLVEPLQTFSVAWVLLIMASSPQWPRALTLVQLAAAIALGLIAKASTPLFMAAPVAVAIYLMIRTKRQVPEKPPWRDWRVVATAVLALVLIAAVIGWYWQNLPYVRAHAQAANTTRWGVSAGFGTKSIDWLHRLAQATFIPFMGPLLIAVLMAGLVAARRRGRLTLSEMRRAITPGGGKAILPYSACALAIVIVLSAFSTQTTDVIRFITPLTACVALLIAGITSAARSRAVAAVAIGLMALQLILASSANETPSPGWMALRLRAPVQKAQPAAIRRLTRLTCTTEANNRQIAITPVINSRVIELTAREEYAPGGRLCSYAIWPLVGNDTKQVWKLLREIAPVYIIALDPSNPRRSSLPVRLTRLHLDSHDRAVAEQTVRLLLDSHEFGIVPGSRKDGVMVLRRTGLGRGPGQSRIGTPRLIPSRQ